jgi:hypothetical protein
MLGIYVILKYMETNNNILKIQFNHIKLLKELLHAILSILIIILIIVINKFIYNKNN